VTTETQAAIVRSVDGDFVVEDVILADLKPDEALVEIHACGICHMDVEAKGLMALPCVMGHEGAGIVVKVGSDVSSVRPGDRVILGYGFCGQCQPCNHGQPFFCDESWDLTFSGKRLDGGSTATFRDGQPLTAAFFQQSSFARHAITPARSLVNISDDVPWHIAAALPCGFLTGVGSSKNVLGVESGSTLLVRGVGAVGMGAIVGAKMAGCTTIVASDLQSSRLNLAREFGATTTHPLVPHFLIWRDDMIAIVDVIERGNFPEHVRPVLAKADINRLGYFGMSFGAAAIIAAHSDKRAKAGISLDGGVWDATMINAEIRSPVMIMHHDGALSTAAYQLPHPVRPHSDFLLERFETFGSRPDVVRIEVAGATHSDFTDFSMQPSRIRTKTSALGLSGTINGTEIQVIMNDFVKGFFDRYVLGDEDAFPADLYERYEAAEKLNRTEIADWADSKNQ